MENEVNIQKTKNRMAINSSLLAISFSIFIFIIAFNGSLMKKNIFVPIELTAAIPLFLSANFANSKLTYSRKKKMWENYCLITFVIAYSFLINIVGILLSLFVSVDIGMLFFFIVILTPLIYSTLAVIENPKILKTRIIEDLFFIILVIIGGVLPSLMVY
ncbi:MAG: hypothetical protein WCK26_03890 [Candidatus Saccharibacteria bacterium]